MSLPLCVHRLGLGAGAGRSPRAASCQATHLPDYGAFREKWEGLVRKERGAAAADVVKRPFRRSGSSPALVVGIMSRGGCADMPFRDVIRRTWMDQVGVCTLSSSGPRKGCSVYVTFVVGREGGGAGEEDVTVLDFADDGWSCISRKVRAWFQHAAGRYSWATHVAKMDMDAFPHIADLLSRVEGLANPCQNVYGGRPWTSPPNEYSPPAGCRMPVKDNFMKYRDDGNSSCWSYMQGALYLMSRTLAANVSQLGGWFEREADRCAPEDMTAGHAIHKYARAAGACVAALKFHPTKTYWHSP